MSLTMVFSLYHVLYNYSFPLGSKLQLSRLFSRQ